MTIAVVLLMVGSLAASFGVYQAFQVKEQRPIPISFQLSWTHNGGFAGFYTADQDRFYERERLEVTFREGGPKIDPIDVVLQGQAQIGYANANLIIRARAEGKPVRAVAAVQQRNPVVFVAH